MMCKLRFIIAFFPFCLYAQSITYTYDAQNRLARVVYPSGKTIVYSYDLNGNRKSMILSGGSAAAAVSYTLRSDWNMVSLPVSVANPSPTTVFNSALPNTLNAREGGQYVPKAILETCKAYWLKSSELATATVSGTPVTTCTAQLEAGWNMIAAPNCSLPLGAAQVAAGVLIPNTLNQYNGTYNVVSQLEAGNAYWVKAATAGAITLTCGNTALGKTEEVFSADLSSFGILNFRTTEGYEKSLYFGGRLPEGIDPESFSMPPIAPSVSGLDARFGNNRSVQEASPEAMIRIQTAANAVQVQISRLPQTGQYALITALGEKMRIQEGKSFSIPAGQHLRLVEANTEIPERMVLEQNYPNPFSTTTFIRYGLPDNAISVRLSIFDLTGRLVQRWDLGNQEAGYHTIEWHGKTQNGNRVASGVYHYRLETAQRTLTKSMTLVR